MAHDEIRVYALARELGMPFQVVIEVARRLGYRASNPLSRLGPEQRAAVEKLLRRFPPEEPPPGMPSRLRPRGPGPGAAYQAD
jgi:hypothetical protein